MNDKWQGWAAAGAVLMVVVGAFRVFSGIVGLFNDQWLVRSLGGGYYFVDVSALAWWFIVIGVILLLAGYAVMNGKTWGRVVGVVAVSIALVSESHVDPALSEVRVDPSSSSSTPSSSSDS